MVRQAAARVALTVAVAVTLAAALAAVFVLQGCQPAVRVDGQSPRCTDASIAAGSDLTEASQYVEVRLSFDAAVQAADRAGDDFDILVDGKPADPDTVAVDAWAEGSDVVVRLTPTERAAQGGSVYFAMRDGQLSLSSKRGDGALPHVTGADGGSTAVLDGTRVFTVPTGMRIGGVVSEGASVTFNVEQFAQLRCCAWFKFGEGLPLVKMHNHAFYRDTPQTAATRLADTVNANYADAYEASCDGATVTVKAKGWSGAALDASLVQGAGVDLTADASADPDGTDEGM